MMRLKDKVALVTGAASGNGRAIARGFAREGAWVAIVDRNGPGVQAVAEEIRARGGRALSYTGDVADAASVQTVVRGIETEWGRLNVLVNNAGVGTIFPFLDTDPTEWDHILDINLRGVLLYCYHGGRLLRESKGGSIINITSQLAEIGLPERSVYCASKGGVKMFTRCLALDVAKFGIRVNAIGPGVIRTAMSEARLKIPERLAWYENRVPLGRVGEPEDLVGAAVFLASDESAYVTGTSLYVDGGYLAQ
jgi:NAD(P)-dependent dehydrogenase (short-subunit alcohol dehydrogenase family)